MCICLNLYICHTKIKYMINLESIKVPKKVRLSMRITDVSFKQLVKLVRKFDRENKGSKSSVTSAVERLIISSISIK